jgi:hypothetical protein
MRLANLTLSGLCYTYVTGLRGFPSFTPKFAPKKLELFDLRGHWG